MVPADQTGGPVFGLDFDFVPGDPAIAVMVALFPETGWADVQRAPIWSCTKAQGPAATAV